MSIRTLCTFLGALALGACATSPNTIDHEIDSAEVVVPAAEEAIEAEELVCSVDELIAAEELAVGPGDLWVRIREGFALKSVENEEIMAQLRWYAAHQSYLDRVATRAMPYMHLIVEAIEERGMPMEIALLPIVESAFDPFAYSHGRAAGLWQFIPGTGKRFKLKQNWWYDGRRDVTEATRAALDYLEYLHGEFDDWQLALAAYNSGEGNVGRAIRYNKARNLPVDFWNLRLPKETSAYVPKLLALKLLVEHPERYGVSWRPIADEPYLAGVDVGRQIDLALAAELAGMDIEQVYLLNPAFNRWATDPEGPHTLLLPLENVESFQTALAELGESDTVRWQRHRIRTGESLLSIAGRYNTTVDLIREINGIRGNLIRAGDTLTVPVAMKSLNGYALTADNRLDSKQSVARNGTRVDHRVASGESFWSISRSYGVGIRELAAWNNMAPTDPLRVGQKLAVWTSRPATAMTASMGPAERVRTITYTVRRGDSLARIASKFGVGVSDITRWNNISTKSYLQPGQRLTLRVDVTNQST
ncbi:MAG: LysM peptidoglycan-binding domain-containing protein [Proteobacteria bacterium]|nr:LysM peptidoglycan-binding domain-containing protein [Pseudomonadota bacterium]